jgi:thiol-disulfide isomerase/thioredoxin
MRRTALLRVVVIVLVVGVVASIVFVVVGAGSSKSSGAATLPASPTALPTFSDDQFKTMLSGLEGGVVVVNVWASWCGPCIKEAPGLAQLSSKYGGSVQFVGVDIADQPAPARAFIRRFGWTYPSVADPQQEIKRGYGFLGQPDTVVYAKDGTILWQGSGAVDTANLQAQIEKALA